MHRWIYLSYLKNCWSTRILKQYPKIITPVISRTQIPRQDSTPPQRIVHNLMGMFSKQGSDTTLTQQIHISAILFRSKTLQFGINSKRSSTMKGNVRWLLLCGLSHILSVSENWEKSFKFEKSFENTIIVRQVVGRWNPVPSIHPLFSVSLRYNFFEYVLTLLSLIIELAACVARTSAC